MLNDGEKSYIIVDTLRISNEFSAISLKEIRKKQRLDPCEVRVLAWDQI